MSNSEAWSIYNSSYDHFPWHERRSPDFDWRDTLSLKSDRYPYWWPYAYSLQPQVTLDSAIAPSGNFAALKLMAHSSQTAGFRTQLRQELDNRGGGASLSKVGIEQANFAGQLGGTRTRPWLLDRPYRTAELMSIINRCANKAVSTDPAAGLNNIQIVIQGVRQDVSPVSE